jgi:uncharacterized protein
MSTVAVLALGALGGGFVTYATQGVLTRQVWGFALVCLPATFLGAFLGIRLYGRVNDRQFRAVVLWVLLVSGAVLIVSNLR